VKPLDKKLLRDLRRLAPQVLAIALLSAMGVAVAVMSFAGLKALTVAEDRFYGATRFADVFATATRAPRSLVRQLQAIDGVTAVDARAATGGLAPIPGLVRPASVRLIALPDDPHSALNGLVLDQGRLPDAARPDEAVALKSFLKAAQVKLGDRLVATVGGRRVSVIIVGSVMSPEYVYPPSGVSTLPDDAHTAVIWARRALVEGAAGQVGAFGEVSLKLAPGAVPAQVTPQVDQLLASYGGIAAVGRADQASNHILEAVLGRLHKISVILPPVFLIIAAGLTQAVVARLIDTEREEIGLLKAFGYNDLEAAAPYLKLSVLIGLLGALMGGLLGGGMGALITGLWRGYFAFPVLAAQFDWTVFLITGSASIFASVTGALIAVQRVVKLRPALAMQAEPPASYRKGFIDRIGLTRWLDQPSRMILRRIARFPGKAALTATGLAASLALLVGTQYIREALDLVVDQTYYVAQRWSVELGFQHPRARSAVAEALRLPGVLAAEPVRTSSAWALGPKARKQVAVLGLEPDARLNRPLDTLGRPIPFLGEGVVLSQSLGTNLGLRPGDRLELDMLEGRRQRLVLPVSALADDYTGVYVYMDRRALNRALGEGDLVTGADLVTGGADPQPLYRALEARPQALRAASRDDTVSNWRNTATKSFSVTLSFYVGFAAIIAYGVAYNMGRITFAERARDLATLQVLGFSRGECLYILAGEIGALALLATPLGLWAGTGLAHGLAAAFSREELRFPVIISGRTLGFSFLAYLTAVAVAAGMVAQRVWKLDLVTVLKTRD
jgi:putative ABC transport system permease protein